MRIVDAGLVATIAASSILPSQLPCFGPPPSTLEEYKRRHAVEEAFEKYWISGIKTSEEDEKLLAQSGEFASTYGEVTPEGARSIFTALGIGLKEKDLFGDLGSGVGKLAVQAYLETGVQNVIAVELSTERDRRGRSSWSRCVRSGEAERIRGAEDFDSSAVQFVCSDIMEAPLDNVTHCFCSNLCFSHDAIRRLSGKIASMTSLHRAATLKPLLSSSGMRPMGTIRAAMSWNIAGGGTEVYLYEKKSIER
uniref:Histone-lysine N-methyltransferase, H3 lysine-79 specific n=1 Tax=Aureoumbra lagunensis TaxID=44058 RepID=A0A7S3NMG9_9STRA|mmetsp:Transcript_23803/g.30976  ORF Transcript_23803/g.30976 Transcript_23803/m.30976 type:complete len:251 (+) Transcript_23803:78-830(+)|eukprot:CAMPEP_0197290218 /NCGR_PEP_ID=MMETSP0890-20130614/7455_1 /TAXON_ID=44058 ORGANISM="Aureoumbra lagunensis, Strain CCMP1510" /NCGR_SAMPLE_ID=MMETSP0890 /ASSEMBLY_ACC=CAM_ASM_000533 /LENGTH=250 /DNA_ID=CAMNT_0042762103 /DNA_START=44 /DNA_END=796 /DNA_ORIENTATION=-